MGKPTPEQLAKINQLALVPLSEDQVYTFPAKVIGTNLIPKYMMKVTPNFLQKMVDQAKQGVALMIDHPWKKWETVAIPYGRTFDSQMMTDGDEMYMNADHYMVLGQTFDGISTDDLAAGIDAGTIFDTSAGFVATQHLCSICGDDYYGGNCPHIAGEIYGDNNMCVKLANDGYLMENSLVFDGGYEGAGIGMSKTNGKHVKSEFIPLDATSKTLPGDGRIFYAFSVKSGCSGYVLKDDPTKGPINISTNKEGSNLEYKQLYEETKVTLSQKEQALSQKEAALTKASATLESIRTVLGVTSDEEITGKLTALSQKAALGERYGAKVIDEALGAGVRALGDAFNTEAMKLAFSNLPIEEVEKIRDSYEAQAKVALGGGGQHVVNGQTGELPADPTKNPHGEVTLSAEEKQAKAREEARAALSRHGYKGMIKEANN